ncbi:hypothetical protein [Ensifer aridi]|uniref:hypothetical protein n=1 Tax=Ensifer aridi TaxID=1708715 RepID=UPI000A103684|nr:hypothetical protein [Ensifer aridi]
MVELSEKNARLIIDAIAVAIDGKPASAKTFSKSPFTELSDFDQWGQEHNNSERDTTRTDALTIAYLIFSGGRIPLKGIQMSDSWFRPDRWIMGALVKKGRARLEESGEAIVFTDEGWAWIAGILQGLKK